MKVDDEGPLPDGVRLVVLRKAREVSIADVPAMLVQTVLERRIELQVAFLGPVSDPAMQLSVEPVLLRFLLPALVPVGACAVQPAPREMAFESHAPVPVPFRVWSFLGVRTVVALIVLLHPFVEGGVEGVHLDLAVLVVVPDVEPVLPVVEAYDTLVDDRLAIRDGLLQYVSFGFLGLHPSQAEQDRKNGGRSFHVEPVNPMIMQQEDEMSNLATH